MLELPADIQFMILDYVSCQRVLRVLSVLRNLGRHLCRSQDALLNLQGLPCICDTTTL